MDELLDEQYLTWLYSQVADEKQTDPQRTYWFLMRILFTKEFIWIIANDDNRVEDGRDLRHEFLNHNRIRNVDDNWLTIGCSMLEMILGVAKKYAFEVDSDTKDCFWHILENLQLSDYNDKVSSKAGDKKVNEILDDLIFRNYSYNGLGGMFPIKDPEEDQRDVEIWYQLCNYILERM